MTLRSCRRYWWQRIRRYAYEVCDRCGRPVSHAFGLSANEPTTYWFADNHVWNAVNGSPNGVMCPRCFQAACDEQGVSIGWRAGICGEIEPEIAVGATAAAHRLIVALARITGPEDSAEQSHKPRKGR